MSASRREFMRHAAGALGAGALLDLDATNEALADALAAPVPAASPRAPLAQGEPVRIGIIGTGGMGTGHLEGFVNAAKEGTVNVRVVGLADICRPRLLKAKEKAEAIQGAGTIETYEQYRDLLARPDLQGVLIASPEHWHQKMAEDAILAGKDVYVEKPMTLRLPQAIRLLKVTNENPTVRVNVGTQYVMTPSYNEARKLIDAGAIGKATFSQTSYCRNSKDGEWLYYEIDPAWQPGVNLDWNAWCGPGGKAPWSPEVYARWRRYRRWSTGIIGDLLVHRITPLIHAVGLGWPTRVTASGAHLVDKAMENHDQVNLNIEFENEHIMVVAGSTCNELGLETLIRGHKANIYLGGRNTTVRPERLFSEEVEERTIEGESHGDDQALLRRRWIECIRTREPVPSPVELGAKVMVIVDLATRSMWEGSAFGFDPVKMKVKKL
jgi:predicted dehydrogenase